MKRRRIVTSVILAVVLLAILLFLLLGGLDSLLGVQEEPQQSDGEGATPAQGLYINEIVASNSYSLLLDDGSSPDWVEIYNNTGQAINLTGYGLSDDENSLYKFEFPQTTLADGAYLVVLCCDENDEAEDGYLRTDFNLSADGETVVLSAPNDQVIDQVAYSSLTTDVSYGRTEDGAYTYFGSPTPGAANAGVTSDTPDFSAALESSPIVINEFLLDNQSSIVDADGERHPWVEIKNTGDEAVDITGYFLSDNQSNTKKWAFPSCVLQPGELKIVILSGKDEVDANGNLHASFSLSKRDTKLILSQSLGRSIDVINVTEAMATAAYGRDADGNLMYFADATPGKENTSKGFEDISKSTEQYLPDISISEPKPS